MWNSCEYLYTAAYTNIYACDVKLCKAKWKEKEDNCTHSLFNAFNSHELISITITYSFFALFHCNYFCVVSKTQFAMWEKIWIHLLYRFSRWKHLILSYSTSFVSVVRSASKLPFLHKFTAIDKRQLRISNFFCRFLHFAVFFHRAELKYVLMLCFAVH